MKDLMKGRIARKWLLLGVTVIITALGLWLSPIPAQAVEIDFNVAVPTAGTISYGGGPSPLVGSGISVDTVVGLDTPLNDGTVRTCASCTLDFTTGGSTGSDATHWFFSPGGSITITGGLDLTPIPDGDTTDPEDVPDGSLLLTGSFTDTPSVATFGPVFKIAGAAFGDTKNQKLTEFYGLPDGSYAGGLNLSFRTPGSPPAGFTSRRVFSGDVVNSPVPEPASLILLGSGLVGLGLWRKLRNRG